MSGLWTVMFMAGAAGMLTTLILVDADSTTECLKDNHDVSLYKKCCSSNSKQSFLIFWHWLIRYVTDVSIHPVVQWLGPCLFTFYLTTIFRNSENVASILG
jgi:hypothetical protein